MMEFPLNVLESALAFIIITLGSILQGSVGFGLGLLAVPLLILIDPYLVPGPIIFAAFFLNILVSYRERREIEPLSLKWVLAGRLIGTIAAAYVLTLIPRNKITILLGVVVLLGVGFSVWGLHLPVTSKNLLSVGTLSGFMATSSAVGGPPLALIYQNLQGPSLRGKLSGIFLIGTIMALISLAIVGRFGILELKLSLVLFPGILLGFTISNKLTKFLDRGFVRPAVLIVSGLSGIVVILRTLLN